MIKQRKCICDSYKFHKFNIYSEIFQKNVLYYQCLECGIVFCNDDHYDLSKIYRSDYFDNLDVGWKNTDRT